jgi:Flp pilus assembly protein TadD
MRDGESFFAEGRSDANYALKQKALKEAKRWRLHLRARVLERLEDMNRGLIDLLRPGAAAQLKLAAQGETLDVAKAQLEVGGSGGGGGMRGVPGGPGLQGAKGRAAPRPAPVTAKDADGSLSFDEDQASGESRSEGAAEPMPEESADSPMPSSPPVMDSLREEEEKPMQPMAGKKMKVISRRGRHSNRKGLRDAYGYTGGLSAHHAAELARLGFLPVEDAPPPPARWNGFTNLFPRLPLRAFDPQTLQPNWPEALKTLLGGLDRGAWLQGQGLSIEITTSSQRVDHRGRTIRAGQGVGVLSPKGWALLPVHLEGDSTQIHWALGKERGALDLLWKTSRVRPAKEADLGDYPSLVPYLFSQSFLRRFVSYEGKLTKREGDRATIRFEPPQSQRRYANAVEVEVDLARGVILESRSYTHGKLRSKVVFSDFVQVAGRHWPTKETPYDDKGKAGWVKTRSYRALQAPQAQAAVAKIMAPRQGATEIGPLPGLDEARQAVEGGKPRLEDRLVALSLELGQQRWEDATPAVEALFQSLGQAEASFLFRATWRTQRRRLEELRKQVQEAAAALGEKPARVEVARANALIRWANAFGPAERLIVLERLRPVFVRQTERLDPAYQIDQNLVNVLNQAGRGEEAFRLRERMSKDYPFVSWAQVAYAQALGQRGEVDAAVAHLDERLAKGQPWLPHEAGQLREEIARQLWRSVRYRKLIKRIDAWDAAKIEPALAVQHYDRLLAALIMLDREDEVDERIGAWLTAFQSPLTADLATWHRVQGAVNHLLGQMPGVSYYHRGALPPARQQLLTKVASRLLSADKEQGEEAHQRPWQLGARILYDYRYRRGDASKPLTKELWAELEGSLFGVDATERSRNMAWMTRSAKLIEWLRGVGYAPAANREASEGKPAAGWPKVFQAVFDYWKAGAPSKEAQPFQNVILSYAKRELQLACRRHRLALAKTPVEKRQRTLELYSALVGGPWSAEAETEVAALFQTLSPPAELKGEVLAEGQNAWIAILHDLHGWVANAQGEARFQALPNRNQFDRRQVKAQRDAMIREARVGLRKRLQETGQAWPELLRPWLEIESLWLGVKLKADKGQLLVQARNLLKAAVAGAAAAKGSPATDLRWRILASRAVATQILLLADLEPTSEVRKIHGQAFEDLINQAMGKKNELLAWREVLYCYLTVVNGQDTLRKRLAEWFGEGKEVKERRWGRALAAVLVESDELAKAASILKALEKELTHEEWRRLADFYHVLDRRLESRWAKVQSWAHLDEWRLQQGLQNDFYRKYQRRGKRVPEELDDEVPLRFLALLRKSSRPQNHVYVLRNYYSSTRDFRLLSCVPEAAIGQSAQGIYQLAAGYRQISNLLQEEATVDQLKKRLVEIRKQAKTVTDKRALDLIDFLTALRAARQRQGGEQAGREALVALKRAFERANWAKGEDRLWAEFLSRQGRLRPAALAEEQLRQLRVVAAGAKLGTPLHVELSRYLAQTQWLYQQRERALQTLEASIQAARHPDGSIPSFAWSSFEVRISYLQSMRGWRQAETEIQAEQVRPSSQQMARNLQQRLDRLYVDCLRGGGEVSLGREEKLFGALLERTYTRLGKAINENQAQQQIYQAVNLIRIRSRYRQGRRVHNQRERAAIVELRDVVTELAHTRLPKVLTRFHHRNSPNMINQVGSITERILGPLAALEFHVQRAENEPRWLRLCNWDAWSNRSWQMAELRRKADGGAGRRLYRSPLGKRFLAIVLGALERHLAHGQNSNQSIYYRNNSTFWSAAAGDYLRIAEKVVRQHGSRVEVLNRVCQYLWHGLDKRDRALTLLLERDAAGKLNLAGRRILAGFLFAANRHGEAIPVYRRLIEERPQELDNRLQLVRCLHYTKQVQAGDAAIAAAIKMLKERKAWREHSVYQVGMVCLQTRRFERAEELIADAIKMHTRGRSNRGVSDGTLGAYYRELASARSAMGNVIGAVDAAAGAIVAWGGHRRQRQRALARLERILGEAKDLGKYIAHLDAEVARTGLENPLLRRSIGKVLMGRGERAAARDQLVLALEARETDEVTHRLLIKCYDRLGDPRAAALQLLALARVQGHKPQIYVELGDRLTKAGDAPAAERAYTTLVEQQPNEAAAQGALAKVRERQGRFGEAAIHWTQWIRVRSDEPEGYIGLARSLILDGRREEAQKPLKQLRTRKWDPRFESTIKNAFRKLNRLQPSKKKKRAGRSF